MNIVIITGGEFTRSELTEAALKKANIIIAADSGANTAVSQGVIPETVIGDMDSISEETKKILFDRGIAFNTAFQEKDETDTELAIMHALKLGATEITILGGLAGDRLDHIITNLLQGLFYDVPIRFINGFQTSFVIKGPKTIILSGKPKDLLSIIPLSPDVTDIKTTDLYYPLNNEPLILGKSRGVSNVFLQATVSVYFKHGILLFIHTQIR